MVATVNELIFEPFLNRSREEKIKIIREGKPRPSLPFLKTVDRNVQLQGSYDDLGKCVVVFDPASYDHVDWLTGCNIRQALFCWPCLLFRIERDRWNRTGVNDLSDLRAKIDTHAKCISHIQSTLDLKLFLPQTAVEVSKRTVVSQEAIQRNREIARRIIDVISVSVAEQHSFEAGSKNSLKIECCIRDLQLIRDYDIVQTSLIDDTIEILKISPEIVGGMVEAITSVMRMSIQTELQQSTYVSMILSEHSPEPAKSQISVVLRYLKGSKVCERFVGFINTDEAKSCNSICKHINEVLKDFKIAQRMLAYSLDGSVFADLDIFKQYVNFMRNKEDALNFCYPYICLTPCHFHQLDYVLQQSLSVYSECDTFFKNLETLRPYFRKGSKMRQEFEKFLDVNRSTGGKKDLSIFDSTTHSNFFLAIKLYWKDCTAFLEHVLNTHENMTEGDLAKNRGLCAFLKHFRTFFLLEVVVRFFFSVSPLAEALHGDNSERSLDTSLVGKVCKSLLAEEKFCEGISSQKSFVTFFESVIETYEQLQKPVQKKELDEMNNICFYSTLYANILRCITRQITNRFMNEKKLALFNVLHLKRKGKPLNVNYVKKLTLEYPECFAYANIEKEMASLEKNREILDCESVHQVMEQFIKLRLKNSCQNIYKLLELVLTLPSSIPNLEEGPTKLEDLTAWSGTPGKHENVGDLSLLGIEREFLEEIRKRFSFHDEVMVRFQEKNDTLQLR